ncbi:MAG: NADP-dependent oxidoreductase [Pseudonocardiales bacterium]|nr:MAG: NADP-dependent oxidoreductase [Pseudonocardiales bacterium]
MTQVRAVVIDGFTDSPHPATFAAPGLAEGQVLIAVQAASINAFDWKEAEGRFKDSFEYQFPVTIGRDYAGVVTATGPGVSRVRPGDAVFGYFTGQRLHRGSYATHVWCAEGECFVPRPPGLPADAAACLPLAGVVALRCVAAVRPAAGQRVLILGAPGGAGSFCVQLAARRGAHVIASGLPEDDAYLRDLGAADVIEPGDGVIGEVRARWPGGVHGLIDLVDYRSAFMEHAGLLVHGGRAASVHRAADEEALASRGLRGTNVGSFPDRALLDQLGSLAAAGDLRVPITGRYTLDEAVTGLADARSKHSRGKLVIEVSSAGA